ncbi:MAG TPA: hypothetical protein VFK62_00800 [Gaiellaceae bacterium]|nr:hypothetical protein [Gaiellaceae bacterium]
MGLLDSPRQRRRLIRLGIVVGIVVPLIVLGIHFSQPGNPENATGPNVNVPGYSQPKNAPFTAQRRREVGRVLRQFILTAVDRQDVGRSWNVSAPSLREGFSRKQWQSGDLPVVPYPALDKGLNTGYVEYSYADAVGMEVYLFPKPGSGYSQLTADVELVKGKDGKWLVDYWMPKKFHGPPALSASAKAKAKAQAAKQEAAAKRSRKATRQKAKAKAAAAPSHPQSDAQFNQPQQSKLYWFVPIGVLAAFVLVLVGMAGRTWYRNRREARQYATRG